MAWLKDIERVLQGLSLVAKEAAARQSNGGDVKFILNKTILSATDLTGLTKGKLRQLPPSRPIILNNCDTSFTTLRDGESVHERGAPLPQPQSDPISLSEASPVTTGLSSGGGVEAERIASDLTIEGVADAPTPDANSNKLEAASGDSASPLAKKQRKPRERRVPSTPFSRALGFAGLGAGLAWGTIQESARRLVFECVEQPSN